MFMIDLIKILNFARSTIQPDAGTSGGMIVQCGERDFAGDCGVIVVGLEPFHAVSSHSAACPRVKIRL